MNKEIAKPKQMLIEISDDLHRMIKLKALERRLTMKQYVLQACIKRIEEDKKYE